MHDFNPVNCATNGQDFISMSISMASETIICISTSHFRHVRGSNVRVWAVCVGYNFKGVVSWCPLFRGNFVLKSTVVSTDFVRCLESRSVRFLEVV